MHISLETTNQPNTKITIGNRDPGGLLVSSNNYTSEDEVGSFRDVMGPDLYSPNYNYMGMEMNSPQRSDLLSGAIDITGNMKH